MTTEPTWRKASFSSNQGNCVELASFDGHTAGVRDSKHPTAGHLRFSRTQLHALIGAAQRGACDHLV